MSDGQGDPAEPSVSFGEVLQTLRALIMNNEVDAATEILDAVLESPAIRDGGPLIDVSAWRDTLDATRQERPNDDELLDDMSERRLPGEGRARRAHRGAPVEYESSDSEGHLEERGPTRAESSVTEGAAARQRLRDRRRQEQEEGFGDSIEEQLMTEGYLSPSAAGGLWRRQGGQGAATRQDNLLLSNQLRPRRGPHNQSSRGNQPDSDSDSD
eukprot:TRINITY_DN29280_c0_g2_i1.p1 TRINITY_DN29280_c0_g2~~TRINITY_DN29280_c0_g2_i1.p1  ORF type:complete len:213 (-),score=16.20 TRINITY_DN29280_c0_g2_i1:327-965(-)